jgi:hypothetical protein
VGLTPFPSRQATIARLPLPLTSPCSFLLAIRCGQLAFPFSTSNDSYCFLPIA